MERSRQAAGMDLYTAMNAVEERKEALWTAWMESEDFEAPLRLAIQEVEARKLEDPGLNVSASYQLGRLDGYVELFEQLFRAKERDSAVRDEPSLRTDKVQRILRTLYRMGELRHGELADAVDSSYSSLTNIMKKVLLSGAVESVRAGRNTRYHLTDAGRRYCERNLLGEDKFFDRISEAACEGVEKALHPLALRALTEMSASLQPLTAISDSLQPLAGMSGPSQPPQVWDLKINDEIFNSVELKMYGTINIGMGMRIRRFAEFTDHLENTEEEEKLFAESVLTAWRARKEA